MENKEVSGVYKWIGKHGIACIAAVIFSLSLIIRLRFLSKGPFEYDTTDIMMMMRQRALTPHSMYFPVPTIFSIVIGRLKDWCFQGMDYYPVLAVSTAVIASFAAVSAYLVFRKMFDEICAQSYALLISFAPFFFLSTTYGRIDVAFACLFLPFPLLYLFQKRWVLCGLFLGLVFSSRPESILLLPIAVIYIFYVRLREKDAHFGKKILMSAKDAIALSVIALGLWALLGFLLGRHMWVEEVLIKQIFKPSLGDAVIKLEIPHQNGFLSAARDIFKVMPFAVIIALYGLFRVAAGRRRIAEGLLFLASFIFLFGIISNIDNTGSRYLIIPVFFMCYFAAQGIAFCRGRIIAYLSLSLVVINMLVFMLPILKSRHEHAYQVEFAKLIADVTPPNSLILTQDEEIFVRYYANREILSHPPLPEDSKHWPEFEYKLIKAFEDKRPVYMASTAFTYDHGWNFRTFMEKSFYVRTVETATNEVWYGKALIKPRIFKEKLFLLMPNVGEEPSKS